MIEKRLLDEVKSRDFFKRIDHYHAYDSIKTELILGSWPKEEVFLSIIIPVYDHPIEFIARAIQSALNQQVDFEFKVLVIDDYAFPDKSNGVKEYLTSHFDERIIYYKNKKNLGVFANWNRGIMLSKARWVTILHSDDFFKPNFLKNMVGIINTHPYIDQLACPYEMIDYTSGNVDIDKAMMPNVGVTTLRKVDYREYMYGMYTSIKGSLYKRSVLLELGGFMNQGDGLGLDDYPAMMRFAYYYNTYYVNMPLYVDSWGYNDSLNIKHWYPELIANYYMWKCMEKKRRGLIRWAYNKKDKYNLIRRAKEYENGTSWVGKKVPIDYEELYRECGITSEKLPIISNYLSRFIVRVDQKIVKASQKAEKVEIIE